MRSTLRGPLGWALAAVLLIAACGGAGTGGASPTTAGPKLGSAERPIQLAITPSAEVQRLTATGNVIAAALGKSTGLTWKVSVAFKTVVIAPAKPVAGNGASSPLS